MVRRGSTVRVRQRALKKSLHIGKLCCPVGRQGLGGGHQTDTNSSSMPNPPVFDCPKHARVDAARLFGPPDRRGRRTTTVSKRMHVRLSAVIRELLTRDDFWDVVLAGEGVIVVIDKPTDSRTAHPVTCPTLDAAQFVEKVITNSRRNGSYHWAPSMVAASRSSTLNPGGADAAPRTKAAVGNPITRRRGSPLELLTRPGRGPLASPPLRSPLGSLELLDHVPVGGERHGRRVTGLRATSTTDAPSARRSEQKRWRR